MTGPFVVRRVVVGAGAGGRAEVLSDGAPACLVDVPGGLGRADVWSVSGSGVGSEPPAGPFEFDSDPGGVSWRILRFPAPDPSLSREEQFLHWDGHPLFCHERRGMHITDSIDLEVILDGAMELEVDEGCVQLAAGDLVVQRGTRHRWRVLGDGPCTYSAVTLRPGSATARAALAPRAGAGSRPRRVITGLDDRGCSIIEVDGAPPNSASSGGATVHAVYETGGPLADPLQGGDASETSVPSEPLGGGVSWRLLELGPGADIAGVSSTLSLVFVVDGAVDLEIVDEDPVLVGFGDCVVIDGVAHRWREVAGSSARLAVVVVPTPGGADDSARR
jgi:mannose-6-phosphate isomerase-like protein (cupin superfamily)